MIERLYIVRILLCFLMVTACAGYAWSQQTDSTNPDTVDIGQDDPFAQFPQAGKVVVSSAANDNDSGLKPELFVETVALKSLNAGSLKAVIESMSSKYGRVSTDEKNNALIICDTAENLERILAQVRKADGMIMPPQAVAEQQAKPRPELFVETVILKFLDAKNLKVAIGGLSSEYGVISINEKNNSLIICDTAENLEKILAKIKESDKTPQQIMIEVVILDVKLNDDVEIGINWDILSENNYDVGYRQNFTTSRLASTIESATNRGNATAFNTTGLGAEFSVISGTIRNIVHLIQQKKEVEILASPRVMMVSGQSAYIEAIEELPYTEVTDTSAGGADALTSTEFKEVGVKLSVSATLIDGNDIFLAVEAEQNVTTGQSTTEVPVVDTRKVRTSLLLNDGQVVILGGMRRQEKTKEVDQIPILGDLPLIGALFRNTDTVVKNSELVVFLSPHVYKKELVPDDAMAKYNEIRNRPMLSLPRDKNAIEPPEKLSANESEDAAGELNSALMLLEDNLNR